jgi:hypothetical protein
MTAPVLNVVTLQESNYRDPVATLRTIADQIEAGDYGAVGCVGLVLMGDTVEVFGMGADSDGAAVAVLLNAGVLRLTRAVEQHGKDQA